MAARRKIVHAPEVEDVEVEENGLIEVRSLFDSYAHLTVEDAAQKIIDSTTKQDLFPIVVSAISIHRRNRTRTVEHRFQRSVEDAEITVTAPKGNRKPRRYIEEPQVPVQSYLDLLREEVTIEPGLRVRYEDCTIDLLEQRKAYLETKVSGLFRTIQITDELIKVMRSAKVNRLGDVNPEALGDLLAQLKP